MNTRILLILAAAGACAVAPLVAAGNAHADPIDDAAFLQTLANAGIASGNGGAGLILAGHAVCDDLAAGDTPAGATAMMAVANPHLGLADAGYFVGAAVGAYCPALAPASWSARGTERA